MNNDNIVSKKSVLQIATILSAVILTMGALMPSVFAQEGSGPNVAPIVQNNVDPKLDLVVDPDVIFTEEDCQEASDDIDQQDTQDSEQVAEGEGGIFSPKIQTSVQTGLNMAITPDFDFANCNPTDDITQEREQTSNQQGTGLRIPTSVQDGTNVAVDPNVDLSSIF